MFSGQSHDSFQIKQKLQEERDTELGRLKSALKLNYETALTGEKERNEKEVYTRVEQEVGFCIEKVANLEWASQFTSQVRQTPVASKQFECPFQMGRAKAQWFEEHATAKDEAVRSALSKHEREWQQKIEQRVLDGAFHGLNTATHAFWQSSGFEDVADVDIYIDLVSNTAQDTLNIQKKTEIEAEVSKRLAGLTSSSNEVCCRNSPVRQRCQGACLVCLSWHVRVSLCL